MGLFSFLRKNKQQTDPDQGVYRSRADTRFGPDAEQAELPLRPRKTRAGKTANQQNEAVDPVLPEKKRARRRLVGAVALVLAVVIVLPMILDSEPKPLADDIAIQIPSRDKPAASSAAASVSSNGLDKREEIVESASAATSAATAAPAPAASAAPQSAAAPVTTSSAASAVTKPAAVDSLAVVAAPKPAVPKSDVKPKQDPKPELKPKAEIKSKPEMAVDRSDDSARALAILDGHTNAAPAPQKKPGKFLLQVAALESQDGVNELQSKLREAGIQSYTQKVPTAGGERIRIRVGPFSSKEEAEKARAKLSKLGFSGSLIPG